MDSSIRNVQLPEQVFEPCRMMFKELKDERISSHRKALTKKRKTQQNTKIMLGWGGGVKLLADFHFSREVL
jgi:CRISPR/Cas system CSM-associated protein Csm5 (group 7 of RAMP superfamily)